MRRPKSRKNGGVDKKPVAGISRWATGVSLDHVSVFLVFWLGFVKHLRHSCQNQNEIDLN